MTENQLNDEMLNDEYCLIDNAVEGSSLVWLQWKTLIGMRFTKLKREYKNLMFEIVLPMMMMIISGVVFFAIQNAVSGTYTFP